MTGVRFSRLKKSGLLRCAAQRLRLQGFVAPNPYHFDCFPLRFKRSMTGVRFRYAFAALRLLNHR
ncbi:MAG: hypothetical protein ACK5XN_23645, partial [Bacteroidota bacterium]